VTALALRLKLRSAKPWCCALRRAMLGAAVAWLVVTSQSSQAAPKCTIAATAVTFGRYDVFSLPATPNDSGVGSLEIRCIGGGDTTFPVTLSTGRSNNYASRVMSSGANLLTYNLYTSAARTVVWGDGTGGSSAVAAARNSTTRLNVFGRIPGGQDAAVGNYSDFITATVIF